MKVGLVKATVEATHVPPDRFASAKSYRSGWRVTLAKTSCLALVGWRDLLAAPLCLHCPYARQTFFQSHSQSGELLNDRF